MILSTLFCRLDVASAINEKKVCSLSTTKMPVPSFQTYQEVSQSQVFVVSQSKLLRCDACKSAALVSKRAKHGTKASQCKLPTTVFYVV